MFASSDRILESWCLQFKLKIWRPTKVQVVDRRVSNDKPRIQRDHVSRSMKTRHKTGNARKLSRLNAFAWGRSSAELSTANVFSRWIRAANPMGLRGSRIYLVSGKTARNLGRHGCRENESRVGCYTTRRDKAKEKERDGKGGGGRGSSRKREEKRRQSDKVACLITSNYTDRIGSAGGWWRVRCSSNVNKASSNGASIRLPRCFLLTVSTPTALCRNLIEKYREVRSRCSSIYRKDSWEDSF